MEWMRKQWGFCSLCQSWTELSPGSHSEYNDSRRTGSWSLRRRWVLSGILCWHVCLLKRTSPVFWTNRTKGAKPKCWDSSASLYLSINLQMKCGISNMSSGIGEGASCHHRRSSPPEVTWIVWSIICDMNTKQKETLQLLAPPDSSVLLTFWLSVSADLARLLTETQQYDQQWDCCQGLNSLGVGGCFYVGIF